MNISIIFELYEEITMELLKIKIYMYGPLPFSLNLCKIKNWKSSIFRIIDI